jgi:alpha-amylase
MAQKLNLVMVLHHHQPPGNPDAIVDRCYRQSFAPVQALLARYPTLPVTQHFSGVLLDWLAEHHADYVDRLVEMHSAGRIEILGGAYSDPILPALPREDRIGQILRYGQQLERRFGLRPRGMWLPERVWEPTLAGDLAAAGIEHTILDDAHFENIGMSGRQLHGYWLTDDNSPPIALFAGSEKLRFLIPFATPDEVIAHLRAVAIEHPGAVLVYSDDGEKFGAWPGMHERCFERGWLPRFFDLLAGARDWLNVTTLREVVDRIPPLGKVYIPDSSYREMAGWSAWFDRDGEARMPSAMKIERVPPARVGTWRNFRVKYPASDEMITRMHMVSRRLRRVEQSTVETDAIVAARHELDLAQSGCAYWHGIYPGVYLPELRQAVYRHLITAENLLDAADQKPSPWVEATVDDVNSDVHREVVLANEHVMAFFDPERGGMLYELDLREPAVNLLATCARRHEPYHDATAPSSAATNGEATPSAEAQAAARPVIEHVYDTHPRKALVDHFFEPTASLAEVVAGKADELGDFVQGRYHRRVRRRDGSIELTLSRSGWVEENALKVTKTVTLGAGESELEIVYLLEQVPDDGLHFAVEFNIAALASDAGGAYLDEHGEPIGDLGQPLDVAGSVLSIRLQPSDVEWTLRGSRPGAFWSFPIRTYTRCQERYEWIQQSVVVLPHWHVTPDARGRWELRLTLAVRSPTSAHHASASVV